MSKTYFLIICWICRLMSPILRGLLRGCRSKVAVDRAMLLNWSATNMSGCYARRVIGQF